MAAATIAANGHDRATGPSDHDLVAAIRCGDERAFEELYARYQRRIAAYVYGMVNDYGRAEDITQDVFISALRRMRETERPIAFKPWIYEIAKNACIDQFRRSRRAEEISYDAEEGLGAADYGRLVTTGPTLDAAVDTKQQLSHLCGAFGGLSETHHQILVLRELEGLSYREIGERMGLSRPSVESTLFRARRRLTEEYDELVSGQRCIRIQAIIAGAAESELGARDTRRLARHVAHCQPCRRQAITAGLDTGTIVRRRISDRVAAKVAGFFPLPLLLRGRRGGGDSGALAGGPGNGLLAQMPVMGAAAEPVVAGWSKAAVAAATVVLAGAGAGMVGQSAGGSLTDRDGLGGAGATTRAVSGAPAAQPSREAKSAVLRTRMFVEPRTRAGHGRGLGAGERRAPAASPAPASAEQDAGPAAPSSPQAAADVRSPQQLGDGQQAPVALAAPVSAQDQSSPVDAALPRGSVEAAAPVVPEVEDVASAVSTELDGAVTGLGSALGG